ncbi:MAG: ABC transporter ATP-binding protein [Cyanobacteriota bacterium]|nr:ABC transporter ATP-binding protein [Cyanobacteriota bacterium]
MLISLPRYRWLQRLAKQQFGALLTPLLSQQPAAQLIRRTAREQWRVLALNLGSSVVEAFTEGATLAVIFLAVESLTAPQGQSFSWSRLPLIGSWPLVIGWLNSLPTTSVFLGLLALAVVLQALQSFTRYLNQVSVGYFAARCVAKVTALIHQQVLSFSFPCASGYKVGDLTNHAANGPVAVRIQIETTSNLVVGLLMIVTYLAVLVRISPWLLLAVVLLAGVISALQKVLLPRIRAGSWRVTKREVEISSRVTEDFQGLRLLHSSGQLDQADRQLQQQMGELEQALRSRSRLLAVLTPVSSFLPILAIAVIAGLSLVLFQTRNAGVLPNLVTFVLALQRLNQKLSGVANIFTNLADNSSRVDRLNAILAKGDKEFRSQGGIPFESIRRELCFDAVSLRYAPELPAALAEVSFRLPKGQMLALVGPSGAGKSSIADLLVGLYTPSSGRILVDDTPLSELNLASWQQHLGVVSQDTFLFNASLAENIAFGTPAATKSQIQAAAQAAQADGFIQSLPEGYATLVGERGYRLSGGQRQRISLARAILRQPELLILDEATSALDTQSERLVQEAIERFEHDHTVLVIAHRLSTIVRADQILVLEQGRVVERGTHSSLLAEKGLYAQLWKQQSHAAQPAFT